MKFLCGHCKAKYQIPDEKVAGKTLRMRCHKCGKDIVVGSRTSSMPPPPGTKSTSSRPPSAPKGSNGSPPSALGEEFKKRLDSEAPEPLSIPPAALDEWHVAVNDVPVGPIKREEVGRKIAMGAVTPESLCWREGFDDWRPVRDVPELAALLRKPGEGAKGAPTSGARGSRPGGAPRGAVDAGGGMQLAVSPVGGQLGGAVAPMIERDEEATRVAPASFEFPTTERGSVPESGDMVAEALGALRPPPDVLSASSAFAVKKPRTAKPVGFWIAIGAFGVFAVVFGIVLSRKFFPEEVTKVVTIAAPGEGRDRDGNEGPDMVFIEVPGAEGESGGTGDPTREGARKGAKSRGGAPVAAATPGGALTKEQQEMMERMGLSGAPLSKLNVGGDGSSSRSGQGELTGAQLQAVVNRQKGPLQRCYEVAFRGRSNAPSARINVKVVIGATGQVRSVQTSGGGSEFDSLRGCLEGRVQRWVFPGSSGQTETMFPIVFSPGGTG